MGSWEMSILDAAKGWPPIVAHKKFVPFAGMRKQEAHDLDMVFRSTHTDTCHPTETMSVSVACASGPDPECDQEIAAHNPSCICHVWQVPGGPFEGFGGGRNPSASIVP